ncbi:MAG: hypothetical protein Aurels2KO_18070 [Aureliella sp.]
MSNENEHGQADGQSAGDAPLSWVHAGSCPICGDGLRRARFCADATGEKHFYLLCDECEALWITPDDSGEQKYASMEDPMCPICSATMYGSSAGWVESNDVDTTPWPAKLTVTSALDDDDEEEPSADYGPGSVSTGQVITDESPDDDSSYGKDDPRPGC